MKDQIMMLGSSNSGKTSFMVAAYHLFNGIGLNGVSIDACDKDIHNFFMRSWESLKRGTYPSNTGGSIKNLSYNFHVKYQGDTIFDETQESSFGLLTCSWLDYRGGALTNIYDDDHNNVVGEILDSKGLLIFIDGDLLEDFNGKKKIENYLQIIGKLIKDLDRKFGNMKFFNERNHKFRCGLVFTKFDGSTYTKERRIRKLLNDGSFSNLKKGKHLDGSPMQHIYFYCTTISVKNGKLDNVDSVFADFLLQFCQFKMKDCKNVAKYHAELSDIASKEYAETFSLMFWKRNTLDCEAKYRKRKRDDIRKEFEKLRIIEEALSDYTSCH